MRFTMMLLLVLIIYFGFLYGMYRIWRRPSYTGMLGNLRKEYPHCQFVILYGMNSKKPYGFTFEPKLGILLIVDMETLVRFHTPPEPVREDPLNGYEIPYPELTEYVKEKLNVPESRHPNPG